MVTQKVRNGLFAGMLAFVSLFTIGMFAACGDNKANTTPIDPAPSYNTVGEVKTYETVADAKAKFTAEAEAVKAKKIAYYNRTIGSNDGSAISAIADGAAAIANPGRSAAVLQERKDCAEKINDTFKVTFTLVADGATYNFADYSDADLIKVIDKANEVEVVMHYEMSAYAYLWIENGTRNSFNPVEKIADVTKTLRVK